MKISKARKNDRLMFFHFSPEKYAQIRQEERDYRKSQKHIANHLRDLLIEQSRIQANLLAARQPDQSMG